MDISQPEKTSINTLRALPVCRSDNMAHQTTSTDGNVATRAHMRPVNTVVAKPHTMPLHTSMAIVPVPEDRAEEEKDPGTEARNMDIMKPRRP